MNRKRITQIRDALLANKPILDVNKRPVGFSMQYFLYAETNPELDMTKHNCGTCGCIAGWADTFQSVALGTPNTRLEESAAEWLGLSDEDADDLFYAAGHNGQYKPYIDITPQEAANTLTYLLDRGVVDWEKANR